jgi:squalene-hopene/tetraprenyl-beta-curcumene cyclase
MGIDLLLAAIASFAVGPLTAPTPAAYLDERARTWFAFASANRGEGATRTACLCCHTVVPYGLARPALRKAAGTGPTEYEQKLLAQIKKRVAAWADLDTPAYRLLYDFNEQKKKESWGTEAILSALLLAFDDSYDGRVTPSADTRRAFQNLWKVQIQSGEQQGSWDWLDFGLEPWESKGARYYGAALAAVAVGTAPGYFLPPGADADATAGVKLLRGYLQRGFAKQNLYNRAWALWAESSLEGVLTKAERETVIDQLFAKQREDGGWNLAALGPYARHDRTAAETAADGYATGLVLNILQTAGVPKTDARVAKGLAWLKTNQVATGGWRGISANKKRDLTTHVGKFMSDAATAYAVLALSHP